MPRCKHCKQLFTPKYFNQKMCMDKDECIKAFSDSTKDQAWKKQKAKLKKELETVQDLMKIAQVACNTYIRKRDEGKPCISCGNDKPKKVNAGHYYSSGGHKNVTFNEDNIHLQCEYCNSFLSGNLINYRVNLLERIGSTKFHELENIANETRKYTRDELREIIAFYKEKTKKLK